MTSLLAIIPVYNGERFLGQTLRCLARQTRRPDRVVVIDDCSTDGTRNVFEQFRDKYPEVPAEWRPNPKNLGLFPNLNKCLEAAREADFLHLLLADDLVNPTFYETLLPELTRSPTPSLAYTLAEAIDSGSNRLRDIGAAPVCPRREIPKSEFIQRQCELQTAYCGSLLIKTGGEPLRVQFPLDFPQVGDCVFYAELAGQCRQLIEVGARLTQIRLHDTNATSRNARSIESFVADEWRAMRRIEPLLGKSGLVRWLYTEKLRLMFAARTVVKEQLFERTHPQQARETRELGIRITGKTRWHAGELAVWLRDRIVGRPDY